MHDRIQDVLQLVLADHRLGHLQQHRGHIGFFLAAFQQVQVFQRDGGLVGNALQDRQGLRIEGLAAGMARGLMRHQECAQQHIPGQQRQHAPACRPPAAPRTAG